MQKLLTIKDLPPRLQVTESTIRKWHAKARKGQHSFPLSVNGFKCKLLFRQEDIESWATASRQQQSQPSIESAGSRSKRHRAACEALAKLGVSIAPNGKEVTS